MARSMWRGAIQFGLVTIPVKLYLATEQGGIGFNLLHASCLNRIQMKVYCPFHDEVIPRSETVRGYEWSKGKYVVVTDEDIAAYAADFGTWSSVASSELRVRVCGPDVAVVTGLYTARLREPRGKDPTERYRYTDTWVRRGGTWQCVATQDTQVP